jgi:hypothetical protein
MTGNTSLHAAGEVRFGRSVHVWCCQGQRAGHRPRPISQGNVSDRLQLPMRQTGSLFAAGMAQQRSGRNGIGAGASIALFMGPSVAWSFPEIAFRDVALHDNRD